MRVLVVEDYPPVLKAVAQGLREAGYAVDAASDGQEGLWFAEKGEYDVIVLDVLLPGVDGLTILRKLRAAGRHTHVLLLTARDTLQDRVAGLNEGADDYLVKPFAFEELLARVGALVRRKYDAKSPLLHIGDLEIDTARKTVHRAGESIDLTAREFALLEYLALRPGQPVSRTEIWEHVYDFNSSAQSNVVDVYIGYLRKKIERPDLPPLIHTRRGQGYQLGEAT
jgi:DNA-binding response OmpR family regulator